MTPKTQLRVGLRFCSVLVAAAVAGGSAAGALAGKPAGGGLTSATIRLVNLTAPGAAPAFGQQVTFNVSTTATTYPWVEVRCSKGGTLVYDAWVGYFSSYLFPQVFTLGPTQLWAGGAASCTAAVVNKDTSRPKTLATLNFSVSA